MLKEHLPRVTYHLVYEDTPLSVLPYSLGSGRGSSPHEGEGLQRNLAQKLHYRGTSLIRNRALPGPCRRTMSRALWWH